MECLDDFVLYEFITNQTYVSMMKYYSKFRQKSRDKMTALLTDTLNFAWFSVLVFQQTTESPIPILPIEIWVNLAEVKFSDLTGRYV